VRPPPNYFDERLTRDAARRPSELLKWKSQLLIGVSLLLLALTQPGLSQERRVSDWMLSLDYVEGANQKAKSRLQMNCQSAVIG
jgi:hypothetical protein